MTQFCTNCGTPLDDDALFCTNCGAPTGKAPVEDQTPTTQFPMDDPMAATRALGAEDAAVIQALESEQAAMTQALDADLTAATQALTEDQMAAIQALEDDPMAATQALGGGPEPTMQMPAVDPMSTMQMPASNQMSATQAPSVGHVPVIQTPVIQAPQGAYQSMPLEQPAKKSNTPLIVGIVVAVVVIIAAVLVGLSVFGEQNPPSAPSAPSAPSGPGAQDTSSKENTSATCTISFDTMGGSSVNAKKVDVGGELSQPSAPTRTGYTFDGWYFDSSYSRKAAFPLTVDSDITLYAKWTGGKDASEVTLSVVGKDGTTRTATIHREGTTGRIFPDSNTQALTESEVRSLSDAERCVAWNEIIAAANGYEFKNSGLKAYFNDYCAWYTPVAGSNGTGNLSSVANKNIEMLKRYTDSWWLSLATN